MDKLNECKSLLQQTQEKVTSSVTEWKAFLRFASQIYKYDFTSAMLIYAQRPDATALAPLETWNRVGRRVNRGAKGIPTIYHERDRLTIKFLFDVADTNGEKKTLPQHWEIKPEYDHTLMLDFADRYGLELKEDFPAYLHQVIKNLYEGQLSDSILESLAQYPLPEIKEANPEDLFFDFLADSVRYMVFSRAMPETVGELWLPNLYSLETLRQPEHLFVAGDETVRQSCTLLRQMESTVKQIEHEQKRSLNHGNRISGRERLIVPGIGDSGAGGRRTPDEVRENVHEVPGGGETSAIRNSSGQSGVDEGLPSGGTGSERVRRAAAQGVAQESPSAQDGQSHGADPVQQLVVQDSRGTDGGKRHSPEVTTENTESKAVSEEAAFSVADSSDTLDGNPAYGSFISEEEFLQVYLSSVLKSTGFEGGPGRIYELYLTDSSPKEAIDFLKKEYGIGGGTEFYPNGKRGFSNHDSKGIEISVKLDDGEYSRTVSWSVVEKQIRQLINEGKYLEGKPPLVPQQLSFGTAPAVSEVPEIREAPVIQASEKSGTGSAFSEEPAERINFKYADLTEFTGGQKTHYKANAEAIRLMKHIEGEKRHATAEEQQVLAKYVGWGGIPQAFDAKNDNWTKEYEELKELLTEEEYASARSSTLTAFYTPPAVIQAVQTALENFGFTGGNILEPSCGTGRFFGLLPENVATNSKLYGVELDSVTGRIAEQLYQKAEIQVTGYERTAFPDNFFDVAFGNVPFGQFKVPDSRYSKNNFFIHDYFFAKTLDKVRPGGIIAFVTSKGTLDKANPEVRKYISRRAELIGAVRFPNTMMYTEGNTKVTSDLIFLQKRDRMVDIEPDWVNLTYLPNGVLVNTYFADHPDMMLGDMIFDESMYGNAKDTALIPHEGKDWREELIPAIASLRWNYREQEITLGEDKTGNTIPADPSVRNYTYTIADDKLYYRENAQMILQNVSVTREQRIRGMVEIRDTLRELIRVQSMDYPDSAIQTLQQQLNTLYDSFTKAYGPLTKTGNKLAFSEDSDYPLLCSLENVDEEENVTKADIFSKRTIRPPVTVTHCETAVEALPHCLDAKGGVDIPYIAGLVDKTEEQTLTDLKGLVYQNPETGHYETADEYLSGNVRQKLTEAESAAAKDDQYVGNVEALQLVQPVDLDASQIDVRLGSPLLDTGDIKQFVVDLLKPSAYDEDRITVHYIPSQAIWKINGIYHAGQRENILSGKTYGTHRIDAYELIEISLNQKTPTIRDKQPDDTYKLNALETAAAREKQRVIGRKFEEWVFADPQRRERLVWKYNQTYNNMRIRKFDGSYLTFPGMTPEISLNPHQKNAAARTLQTGNTLYAHCVGAGKTYTMIAAAMESKRLGLCSKSMMVVPGHLIDQWGADILRLYPGANVLLATKKDFEKQNRRRLISRIATGDYDIIVIAQSSFEKIPVSPERIERLLNKQIDDIVSSIDVAKSEAGQEWTIKAMERTKKSLEEQLEKLMNQSRKDDLLTFEELGVDQLFVDEAHYYKNLFVATKMTNVAGIGQQKAQKASDMLMKCRYINEIHNGQRGVVFATGTPISNSMSELFTMQTYLQPEELEKRGIAHFDSWAANFGRVVSSLELTPDGTQYRYKSRFAEFVNLPELMSIYSMVADIQAADMLKLPVPELKNGRPSTIVAQPSERLVKFVEEIVYRFEKIHNGEVEPWEDNALKATNDGRMAALDMRLADPSAEDYEGSKINLAVRNIYEIWQRSEDVTGAQMVFCDLSTPKREINIEKADRAAAMVEPKYNVYYDIRNKLIKLGIPMEQIEFVHNAKTEKQKESLFAAIRSGKVRVLLGSTALMGAGTNAQKHLIALHHLDAPWRPSDVEQREGRILRQGNENQEVEIYRYVTEGTFDAYSWQILEQKQRFISQISHGSVVERHAADIDNTALDYATVKTLSSKDPRIKEREELRVRVAQLNQLKAQYNYEKYSLEDDVLKRLPAQIARDQQAVENLNKDIALRKQNLSDAFKMEILGTMYNDREEAGKAILKKASQYHKIGEYLPIGNYCGFRLELTYSEFYQKHSIVLCGAARRITEIGNSPSGCTVRMENLLKDMENAIDNCQKDIKIAQQQMSEAKQQLAIPWEHEKEYQDKTDRLNQLDVEMAQEIGSEKEQVIDDQTQTVDADSIQSLHSLQAKLNHAKTLEATNTDARKGRERAQEL